MKYTANKKSNNGFTIVELLIATVVFSVVLVVVLAAFVQISRIFYKGVNMSNTQNDARTITQDIEDDINFASIAPSLVSASGTDKDVFCIGLHRYAYYMGQQVGTNSRAGIYREDISTGCPTLAQQDVNTATADQLLGGGMQLNSLGIDCTATPGRCQINVHVVFYGGDQSQASELFSGSSQPTYQAKDAECTGALISSQYCATADYTRTVLQRS